MYYPGDGAHIYSILTDTGHKLSSELSDFKKKIVSDYSRLVTLPRKGLTKCGVGIYVCANY